MNPQHKLIGSYIALLLSACIAAPIASGQTSITPSFGHIVIVVGENNDYAATYNSQNMPYLTSLANAYGLGTNYYSDTHPSIGNYFNLSSGNILTDDDRMTPQNFPVANDNIAHEVERAGKTWKDYVENLPSVKGCGGFKPGRYLVRHDPLEYMTDINTETAKYVCLNQFATDLAKHDLPNFSWLVPNGCDDAHDCGVDTFDAWLKTEISPLLASPYFQKGGDGLLIIVFDESATSGVPNCETTKEGLGCGGKVELVVISPKSLKGHKSNGGDTRNYKNSYDEGDVLRTMAQGLGLSTADLGWATNGIFMADFF